ncbi:MAG TPA: HD domain-containing protein [Holophagaceae bacterium]|nr:HD domain-containing protein [Holophagaceae bacterium]
MADVLESLPWFPALRQRLTAHIAAEPFPRDGAHDLAHILRVARLAARIAAAEGADRDTCVAAALMHDLVYVPKNHPDSPRTAQMAAELVPRWCRETPGLESRAEAVAHAVETHSWSGGGEAGTLEAAVVQDADRLEALGAIGIARVFATGASFGSSLWHPEDPWGAARELDDKAYTLDHFFRKLLKLAEGMKTPTGRRMAAGRQKVLQDYLGALREELGL